MMVKMIVDEDFVNYKKPSMFIATCKCDWKCCKDAGRDVSMCQNAITAKQPDIEVPADEIFRRYISNPITRAIVIGGLEPMLQMDEVFALIRYFRLCGCQDDFVIYTGYTKDEIAVLLPLFSNNFSNVIFKFGRFIPGQTPHFDPVLGVNLASDNQYAERLM